MSTQDVETLSRCVLEFNDVLAAPRLSLTSSQLKFTFFHQCLSGTTRDKWDVLANGVNETLVNFDTTRENLITEIVCPTDLVDPHHYLETSRKHYKLNCATLASCLEIMIKMMLLFPGTNGNLPMQQLI